MYNDLTGRLFNKLLVIERVENDKRGLTQWLCRCECGNDKVVRANHLKNGQKSCGRCIGYIKSLTIEDIEIDPNEEWVDVVEYEGLYMISNKGNVKGIGKRTKKGIHKPTISKAGYYRFNLIDREGNLRSNYQHRLIAMAFIPNPNGYEEVNHINEIKDDNRISNIEWVTHKANCNHGTRVKRIQEARKGYKHSEETKEKMKVASKLREGSRMLERTDEMLKDIENDIGFTKFTTKYNVSGSFYYKTISFYTKKESK